MRKGAAATGAAAGASSPPRASAKDASNISVAASSDAETEPLPFSDAEEADEAADKDVYAHRQTRSSSNTSRSKGSATAMADSATADVADSAQDAAAALAELGELGAAAAPASISPEKSNAGENMSSDSDLSDAPDDEASASNEGDDESEAEGSNLYDEEGSQTGFADAEGEANDDSSDDLGADDEGGEEEENDEDEDDEDEDEDEEEAKAAVPQTRTRAGGRRARQEFGQMETEEQPEGEGEAEDVAISLAALAGGATNVDATTAEDEDVAEAEDRVSSALPNLAGKVKGPRGRKPSLLGAQILIDPASQSTSRQASEEPDAGETDGDADAQEDQDEIMKDVSGTAEEGIAASGETSKDEPPATGTEAGIGTPIAEPVEHDEDAANDEAALRRTEALEALTKIEITFALLRDRLYVERMEEIARENEMILDGTHPELVHLTALVEARRQYRLRMVNLWFEEEQSHYNKMAAAESREAWITWRLHCAELRRNLMDESSRKRRKLEREKRYLDQPRMPRRPPGFEAEVIGEPELAELVTKAVKAERPSGIVGRRRAAREAAELAQIGSHAAVPDLRGLDDMESWTDLERMGVVRPELRLSRLRAQNETAPPGPVAFPPQHGHAMSHGPSDIGYYVGPPPPNIPAGPPVHPGWANDPGMSYAPGPQGHMGPPIPIAEMNPYGGAMEHVHIYPQPGMEEAYAAEQQRMYGHHGYPGSQAPLPPRHVSPAPYPVGPPQQAQEIRNGRSGQYPHHGGPPEHHNQRYSPVPGSGVYGQPPIHHQQPGPPLPHESPRQASRLPPLLDERTGKPYANGHAGSARHDGPPSRHDPYQNHQGPQRSPVETRREANIGYGGHQVRPESRRSPPPNHESGRRAPSVTSPQDRYRRPSPMRQMGEPSRTGSVPPRPGHPPMPNQSRRTQSDEMTEQAPLDQHPGVGPSYGPSPYPHPQRASMGPSRARSPTPSGQRGGPSYHRPYPDQNGPQPFDYSPEARFSSSKDHPLTGPPPTETLVIDGSHNDRRQMSNGAGAGPRGPHRPLGDQPPHDGYGGQRAYTTEPPRRP